MLEAGTVLDRRYLIHRLIGEGGVGAVYEAEHITVHRRVAIKVLLPSFATDLTVVERFVREAQAAAEIGHDNIIEVSDFGEDAGFHYMVMELLHGTTLGERIETLGKLPVALAGHIMGQVLAALGAAHAVGIIHRDLKPENVFLTTRLGIVDFVKLLDFGISKFKAEEGESRRAITRTGTTMGTMFYMAPEQALARRDIDHRADLYSAGVMLYEMLTGRVPFEGDSQAEILMAMVYRNPPLRPPSDLDPEIPAELEAVILKAMSIQPESRFASASEFIAALRPFGATATLDPEALPWSPPRVTPDEGRPELATVPNRASGQRPVPFPVSIETPVSDPPPILHRAVRPSVLYALALFLALGAGALAVYTRKPTEPAQKPSHPRAVAPGPVPLGVPDDPRDANDALPSLRGVSTLAPTPDHSVHPTRSPTQNRAPRAKLPSSSNGPPGGARSNPLLPLDTRY